MRKAELNETVAVLKRLMHGLLGVVGGATPGRAHHDVRRAIADIVAKAGTLLSTASVGAPVLNAFRLVLAADGKFDGFDTYRRQILNEQPVSLPAISVVDLCMRLCLSAQCRLIALMNFTSRQDADIIFKRINAAFELAVEDAADIHDAGMFQALTNLQGATVRDLVDRSMLLPRLVHYNMSGSLPALTLAQKIYPDDTSDRSNELRLENKVVHPLFMPPIGVCLTD
jgi:hypothetical protein